MEESHSSTQSASAGDLGTSRGPATTAAFTPRNHASSTTSRSTILVHQKSPLLLATPPQVTRALAYSHAFIVPLNKIAGLISWTTGDPWESFLFVAVFWFVVLYGDTILQFAGPLILAIFLILGMYFRRYSPLSSTGWTGEKKSSSGAKAASGVQHRKSLDEILATLQAFTGRCNILLAPMLQMTDFLSTQQTATSATTRPALTTLFVRILLASPVWFLLSLPPFQMITGRRVVSVMGTTILTWHSRPARISRAILWRSRTVRRLTALLTGLVVESSVNDTKPRPSIFPASNLATLRGMKEKNHSIRFTFSVYENQRRWVGLGWTSNMVAYERAPWTDEHLNPVAPPNRFILPSIEGGHAKWRWVERSKWQVESVTKATSSKDGGTSGTCGSKTDDDATWVYYDNKWLHGTRGKDGWLKYTRRRKWARDAELVDVSASQPDNSYPAAVELEASLPSTAGKRNSQSSKQTHPTTHSGPDAVKGESHRTKRKSLNIAEAMKTDSAFVTGSDAASIASESTSNTRGNKKGWFGRPRGKSDLANIQAIMDEKSRDQLHKLSSDRTQRRGSDSSGDHGRRRGSGSGSGWSGDAGSDKSKMRDPGEDVLTPTDRLKMREADWGLGDDANMGLG